MSKLSLNDSDRAALAASGVREGPDGTLRSADGAAVSDGIAAALLRWQSQAQPVEPEHFDGGPLLAGHQAPSPGDQPDNSAAAPVTGNADERYEQGAEAYEANRQTAQADHAGLTGSIASKPAVARMAPSSDLRTGSPALSCDLGTMTGRAPGEG